MEFLSILASLALISIVLSLFLSFILEADLTTTLYYRWRHHQLLTKIKRLTNLHKCCLYSYLSFLDAIFLYMNKYRERKTKWCDMSRLGGNIRSKMTGQVSTIFD